MLVTVATFSFPHEAHIARGRLEALGIPAIVLDEHTVNMDWLYSNAMGGVRLQVPDAFVAQAEAALDDDEPLELADIPAEELGPPPAPLYCPHCGGVLGESYRSGRRPALLTWLVFGFPLWPVQEQRRCTACGAEVPAAQYVTERPAVVPAARATATPRTARTMHLLHRSHDRDSALALHELLERRGIASAVHGDDGPYARNVEARPAALSVWVIRHSDVARAEALLAEFLAHGSGFVPEPASPPPMPKWLRITLLVLGSFAVTLLACLAAYGT